MTNINSDNRFIPIRTLRSCEQSSFLLNHSAPEDPYHRALFNSFIDPSYPRILNFSKTTVEIPLTQPRKITILNFPPCSKVLDAPNLINDSEYHLLTSDQDLLAIALSNDIYSYNITTGKICKLVNSRYLPTCIKLYLDADSLIYGNESNQLIAYDIEREKQLHCKSIHDRPTVLVHNEPIFFAGCSSQGHIFRNDIRIKGTTLFHESDDESVLSLAMQNMQIAVGFSNKSVKVFDIRKEKKPLAVFREFKDGVRALSFHPRGTLLAGGGPKDKTIKILKLETRRVQHSVDTGSHVLDIHLNQEGNQMMSCHGEGVKGNNSKLWKLDHSTPTLQDQTQSNGIPPLFSVLAEDKLTFISTGNETINIWHNVFTKPELKSTSTPLEFKFEIR